MKYTLTCINAHPNQGKSAVQSLFCTINAIQIRGNCGNFSMAFFCLFTIYFKIESFVDLDLPVCF